MAPTEIIRYSDEDLQEFRTLIEEKHAAALEQLNYYQQQLQELADGPDNKVRGLDDGTGTTETEELHNHAARQQKLLKHLKNALIRIDNKTYGICRETGKLISKQRLLAVPHATLSIEAKNNR